MNNKKIVITGFNGFVGRHACGEFRRRGYQIQGITNGLVDDPTRDLVDTVTICDLADPDAVDGLEIGDDINVVLNLAGFATNTGGDAELIRHINTGVHVNMCRRLSGLGLSPVYIGVSSSTVYRPDQPLPLTESSMLKDQADARPYEASKIEMENLLKQFPDLPILIARPFNHIGMGQGPGFLIPDLAIQILRATREGTPLLVGNLSSRRDYTWVENVVGAYADLAELQDFQPGEVFNICSGESISGEDILAMLLKAMGVERSLEVQVDPSKLRGASDVDDNYGSYKKLYDATGWSPSENGVQTGVQLFADDFLTRNR